MPEPAFSEVATTPRRDVPSNVKLKNLIDLLPGEEIYRKAFYDGWQNNTDHVVGGLMFVYRTSATRPAEDGGNIVHQTSTTTGYF